MGYNFANRKNVIVVIEDKSYPVAITEKLGERLMSVSGSIPANCKNISETIACIDKLIDEVLGSGKAAEIFAGREADVFERLDVLEYVCSEVSAAVNKFGKRYKSHV